MNKLKIASSIFFLALIAWALSIYIASLNVDSGIVATRCFNQGGICHVEVYHNNPFNLIITSTQGEKAIQSHLNLLTLMHVVRVSTESSYKPGGTSEWRKQIYGGEYLVASSHDLISIQVSPDDEKNNN